MNSTVPKSFYFQVFRIHVQKIELLDPHVTAKKDKRFTVKMLQTHVSIPRPPQTAC